MTLIVPGKQHEGPLNRVNESVMRSRVFTKSHNGAHSISTNYKQKSDSGVEKPGRYALIKAWWFTLPARRCVAPRRDQH